MQLTAHEEELPDERIGDVHPFLPAHSPRSAIAMIGADVPAIHASTAITSSSSSASSSASSSSLALSPPSHRRTRSANIVGSSTAGATVGTTTVSGSPPRLSSTVTQDDSVLNLRTTAALRPSPDAVPDVPTLSDTIHLPGAPWPPRWATSPTSRAPFSFPTETSGSVATAEASSELPCPTAWPWSQRPATNPLAFITVNQLVPLSHVMRLSCHLIHNFILRCFTHACCCRHIILHFHTAPSPG